jgi:Hint domain
LQIDSTSTITALTLNDSHQTLSIGGAVTITGQQIVNGNASISIVGGTLADTSGIQLGNGGSAGKLSGKGIVTANLTQGTGGGAVTASGNGTLDLQGTIGGGLTLAIDAAQANTLKIDNAGVTIKPVTVDTSSKTLEIAKSATINAAQTITGGTLTLDSGATLTDTGGITLAGGTLSGAGALSNTTNLSGSGTISLSLSGTSNTVTASGSTLEITGNLDTSPTLAIANVASSVLKIDHSGVTIKSVTVDTANKTLQIAQNATISGAETITSGTLTIDSGATLTDTAGITLAGGHIGGSGNLAGSTNLSGYGTVDIPLNLANTVTASGGTLEFTGTVDATTQTNFHIGVGATLKFDGAVGTATNHPTVTFDGTTGTLDLTGEASEQGSFYAVVNGFHGSDQIVFSGAPTEGTETLAAVFDGTNTILTAKDGATIDGVIVLSGDLHSAPFVITENGSGQDVITICFMAGTMVRTPDGEVAVESLKHGDLVLTNDGLTKPVSWLGRQTVSTIFADKLRVLPIRIKAGALGENVPRRDLLISPDHAILIDGALIQAGALVNGTSIVRETKVPPIFTYYHVEVDDHSLILAENTPTETFVDNVDRLAFDNWAEHQALYPEGKEITELPYPRAKAHRQVPVNIRVMLAERAQLISAVVDTAAVA